MALAALGVVFGDIGTSPLYTLSACLAALSMPATPAHLLAIISLILWTLILVVAVKYAWFVMRADEHGEGGVMVITALAARGQPEGSRTRWLIFAPETSSIRNQTSVAAPKKRLMSAVPRLCIQKSPMMIPTDNGTTSGVRRADAISIPCSAESTEIAGVTAPSP